MKIESIASAYFRLPLDAMGDAGHGAIDSEELITVKLRAGGLEGHGYAYTIGRGGRAVHALIEHDEPIDERHHRGHGVLDDDDR